MRRLGVIIGGFMLALGLWSQTPAKTPLPPTASEKELQAPLTLEDGKPTPGQAPEAPPSGLRAFGSLVLVLGLAGGSLWALKKYGRRRLPGGGGGRLRVAESLALGDRRYVSILEAEGDRFLVAVTPQGINLLSRLDPVDSGEGTTFSEALGHEVEMTRPVPVKEMEARLKQGGGAL